MFTGLITDIGRLISVSRSKIFSARVICNYNYTDTSEGASICHDGVCLTIFNKIKEDKGFSYEVEVSNETISKSNIIESTKPWKIGKKVNLEKSLKIGDELGGHIVTGHVDGMAKLIKLEKIDESHKLTFECPEKLIKFIAVKGSVALNGTSLTINDVNENLFTVNIIPHTQEVTTWKDSKIGDQFNLEIDLLARYMDRLQANRN
tara:strand:- start:1015 stop:1629 length:615 start_codon:yes stop_codon:yes gene_type:complete